VVAEIYVFCVSSARVFCRAGVFVKSSERAYTCEICALLLNLIFPLHWTE